MVYPFLLYLYIIINNKFIFNHNSLKMNTLITKEGKVVATVSDKHNVTVTEKDIVIELFTTTKTKTKFDLVKKPRRGRPSGSKNKKRLTKSTQA